MYYFIIILPNLSYNCISFGSSRLITNLKVSRAFSTLEFYYISIIFFISTTISFITADMFTEIIRTYYKDYEIIEPVADNDITTNAGWHSYFLDAFGTGLALQKSFETMSSTLLPALVLNKVIIETGNDSKEGTNGKTT